jgi:uncharacterized Zn ribbon protein
MNKRNYHDFGERPLCPKCNSDEIISQGFNWYCKSCRYHFRRIWKSPTKVKHNYCKDEIKIERECLKCDKKFMAEGKYNRICPHCRDSFFYYWDGIFTDQNENGIYY